MGSIRIVCVRVHWIRNYFKVVRPLVLYTCAFLKDTISSVCVSVLCCMPQCFSQKQTMSSCSSTANTYSHSGSICLESFSGLFPAGQPSWLKSGVLSANLEFPLTNTQAFRGACGFQLRSASFCRREVFKKKKKQQQQCYF